MELNEFFTFSQKISEYVAKVRDQNIPDTVLLFEPRMRHPALRVTVINFFLKLIAFYVNLLIKLMKISKKSIFSNFRIFTFFCSIYVRVFDLAISYRPKPDLAQIIKHTLLFPEIHSNWNLSVWSKVKNSIFYQNATNMSPAFRIVIFLTPYYSRAEDETSCSTIHWN